MIERGRQLQVENATTILQVSLCLDPLALAVQQVGGFFTFEQLGRVSCERHGYRVAILTVNHLEVITLLLTLLSFQSLVPGTSLLLIGQRRTRTLRNTRVQLSQSLERRDLVRLLPEELD